MNYIGLINNFWHRYKTKPVSPGAVALFFILLNHANVRMWELPMCLTNEFLTADMHTSKSSFLRYRAELKLNGYIGCEPKSKFMGSEYRIYVKDSKISLLSYAGIGAGGENAYDSGGSALSSANDGADSGLSSYNKKTNKKNINKNFKQNRYKYEIYNSGRYDFEEIERMARKQIQQILAEDETLTERSDAKKDDRDIEQDSESESKNEKSL